MNCKGTKWTITIGKRVHKIIGIKNEAEISTNGVTVEKRGTYEPYEDKYGDCTGMYFIRTGNL